MPFVSQKQRAWGHTPSGEKALGGAEAVAEWDRATGNKPLPDYKKEASPVPPKGRSLSQVAMKFGKKFNGR